MTQDPRYIAPEEQALAVGASLPAETARKELVKRGLELSLAWEELAARDGKGRTHLHKTAMTGQQSLAESLVLRGADVNAKDHYGLTPLHLAAHHSHNGIVTLLLNNGASVHSVSDNGWTPLHRVSSVEVAATLLAHGAECTAIATDPSRPSTSRWGRWDTPVKWAISHGNLDLLRLYVKRASDKDLESLYRYLCDALHHAPSVGIASFILEQRVPQHLSSACEQPSLESRDEFGGTPLYSAVCDNNLALASFLISLGSDINARTMDEHGGKTLLHQASTRQMGALLLSHGIDVNSQDASGTSALLRATTRGYDDLVNLLLEEGADPNLCNAQGISPLHAATYAGNLAIAESLTRAGASTSALNNEGWT